MTKAKNLMSWLLPIVIALLIAVALNVWVFKVVRVDGHSMDPNLHNNERVLAVKPLKVKRFSVVVFNTYQVVEGDGKNSNYVKRVIGLPGDTVSYSNTGKLYINGKYQEQPFISAAERKAGTLKYFHGRGFNLHTAAQRFNWNNKWSLAFTEGKALKVPKDCYFVLGDNRSVSIDSRYWGFVPKSKIVGVVKVAPWQKNAKYI